MAKSVKEPARPKRYLSAFFLFLDDFRNKNASKGYTTVEMARRGGSAWRNLTNMEKFPFEQKSLKLREKYVKDVDKYQEKVKAIPKGIRLDVKARKDPNKPKRALSAYIMFIKEFREHNADRGWDFQEMTLKGATAWNLLSVAERGPYEQLARRNAEKYHAQLADYKKQQKKCAEKQKKDTFKQKAAAKQKREIARQKGRFSQKKFSTAKLKSSTFSIKRDNASARKKSSPRPTASRKR